MALDAFLGKKYKLTSSEDFDDYMKALGVGLLTRKLGNHLCPVISLENNGKEYISSSISTFKSVIFKFKPGVEFEQETPDGRKVKSTITVDRSTLHEVQKEPNSEKATTIDRIFSKNEVKIVLKIDGITATRIYKCQE